MRILLGLLLFYSQGSIVFARCCIPSPFPVSAATAVLLLYCFTLPCLCKHSCVADGCFTYVCVCLGLEVISSKFCLISFWQRMKTWKDLESGHSCIRKAPLPLSCLLLVQLGSCCATGRQGSTDPATFLPAAPQRAPL